MNIKSRTDDIHTAQAHRPPALGERQRGEREAADFERALRKAGKAVEPAGDEEDGPPAHDLPAPLPPPDAARPTMPANAPPRRPQSAPGGEEARQEIAATPIAAATASRNASLATSAAEPARGLLPSAAMQDALRAASAPPVSGTAAASLRVELHDVRAPLQHIALQRSATGALDVQVGTDARLRTPLAASADRLRARLAERGASLSSIALSTPDTLDTTDDTSR